MPRQISARRRATDHWSGLRDIALAEMLVGPIPKPDRDALKALDPVERDHLLDAEAAVHREEARYLAWCLGVIDQMDGGEATPEEAARWAKRREKAAKRARKAEKARAKAAREAQEARTDAEPVLAHRGAFTLPDEDEEGTGSRVPLLPPPPRRPEHGAYDDEDDD